MTDTKTCIGCGETKPLSEFYTRQGRPIGRCKPCERANIYAAQKRPPRNPTPAGTKRCMDCKAIKPESAFHRNKTYHDGIDRMCKECRHRRHQEWASTHRKELAAGQRRRYAADPERYDDYQLTARLGLPSGTYAAMFAAQEGKCAICKTTKPGGNAKRRFATDHDAETGQIRGLLCGSCNNGLGRFKHDVSRLEAAISYLNAYPKLPLLETVDSIRAPNC